MFDGLAQRREREPDTYVPYIGHVAPGVVLLDNGDLLAMLHLDGAAWETADEAEMWSRHEGLNALWRNAASDRIVLSVHVVRTTMAPERIGGTFRSEFARDLDAAYRVKLGEGRLYRNELFLSVLLRPSQAVAGRLQRRRRGDRTRDANGASLDLLEASVATVVAGLEPYGPTRLGLRGDRVLFSEIGEAIRLIMGCSDEPVPLVDGHLGGAIYTDRVIVGRESVEIRGAGSSTFAAGFGLREYPAQTFPGMLGVLLSAPYRCVLTQTFGFLNKQAATDSLGRKQNQMAVAGDKAAGQREGLGEAVERLHSNEFVMGTHHLTLVVHADTLPALAEIAPLARRHLAECGAVVVREDLALEAVYWGQLPGNLALRSRPGAVSSRNFAALSPFHNYPLGQERGHWGEPLTLFRTTGGTPYRFHLHAPTGTVTDLGNVFMAGPSGSGKTTLLNFLLAQAERQDATAVLFDKDRGAEILIRALGGDYLPLRHGVPCIAPLKALTNSPRDLALLAALVKGVTSPDKPFSPDMSRRVAQGLRQLMSLPPEHRWFGELRAFLGQSDPDGIGARLEPYCKGGALGWVMDGERDEVSTSARVFGFDLTEMLDVPEVRGPRVTYLFHRVEALMDGRRLILAIDEFWKALLDPGFRDLVNDKLKTLRKQNGAVILATQSPRDALNSPIAHSIIEQCPTQILLPNDRADEDDYVGGLKLTAPEFRAIREDLAHGGRRFLLKQASVSVACDLDLTGMEDFVAVLSGRTRTLALMERLREQHGAAWLAPFMREWRSAAG